MSRVMISSVNLVRPSRTKLMGCCIDDEPCTRCKRQFCAAAIQRRQNNKNRRRNSTLATTPPRSPTKIKHMIVQHTIQQCAQKYTRNEINCRLLPDTVSPSRTFFCLQQRKFRRATHRREFDNAKTLELHLHRS
jgi:hypothetical protein